MTTGIRRIKSAQTTAPKHKKHKHTPRARAHAEAYLVNFRSKGVLEEIDQIVAASGQSYNNRRQFVELAVLRLIDEEKKKRAPQAPNMTGN